MRSFGADAAIAAVPALAATAVGAFVGHVLLRGAIDSYPESDPFRLSMIFLPVFGLAGCIAINLAASAIESLLRYRKRSLLSARTSVIGWGAVAALVGLSYEPSVFVAIAAAAAGSAFALKALATGEAETIAPRQSREAGEAARQ